MKHALAFLALALVHVSHAVPRTLPLREVTIFKDGHAFVLHEGKAPTDEAGNVRLDHLPAPVLGTFWAYDRDERAKLSAVVSGRHLMEQERTALTIPDMLIANIGARVEVVEDDGEPFLASIVAIPRQDSDELKSLARPYETRQVASTGGLVLLQTDRGVRPVAMGKIRHLVFLDAYKPAVTAEEIRAQLVFRLDWQGKPAAKRARVGMTYLQKGIRWIPEYRIDLDGEGRAEVTLQATIVNDLVDLDNVATQLVVGVPSFAFAGETDPIFLQRAVAKISTHFQPSSQTAFAFSNAIMSNDLVSNHRPTRTAAQRTANLGPSIS
jgi:hypothetical protein